MSIQKITTVKEVRIERLIIPPRKVIGEIRDGEIVSLHPEVTPGHIRARRHRGVFNIEGDPSTPAIPKKSSASSDESSAGAVTDISGAARKLAEANGIDLTTIHGSGSGGRIILTDVERAIEALAEDDGGEEDEDEEGDEDEA